MKDYQHVIHTFEPVYNENSKIIILGSFPSVMSRSNQFYYGHPGNRFWKVITEVINHHANFEKKLKETVPSTNYEKRQLLLKYGIALWDVIYSCDIIGSSDSSIKNVVANDIKEVMEKTHISKIYVNGKVAERLYNKYCYDSIEIEPIVLPSTSPANAAYSLDRLIEIWDKMVII